MYLFELIVKWINPKRKYIPKNQYDPFGEDNSQEDECEHIFLPIDSTGEILACSKCGQIIKKADRT